MREHHLSRDNEPPNSRLFIVCGREVTEEDLSQTFEPFGNIEKIEILKDRKGDSKGMAYIKFYKTSEAATALEKLNGRCIGAHPRPLKVLVAYGRDQGLVRDSANEEERLLRLFVVVPRDLEEEDLKEKFGRWGPVQYVNIVRHRDTKESKGFAYIKYYRITHAAKAFESCDRAYKPVFAEPRPPKNHSNGHQDFEPSNGHANGYSVNGSHRSSSVQGSASSHAPCPTATCLSINVSSMVSEQQLWRLFDLIPGLEQCALHPAHLGLAQEAQGRSLGVATYASTEAASYARQKLHGFEYPPGERLIVKMLEPGSGLQHLAPVPQGLPAAPPSHLQLLCESLAKATSLMAKASIGGEASPALAMNGGPAYCSVPLPSPKPLQPMDSKVEMRLFYVCSPIPPPVYTLKDVFSRFGCLVDLYLLSGKRCGFALFSTSESAKMATEALNGQEVCGARLKVMLAEPNNKPDN